jgi:hypothetical protein
MLPLDRQIPIQIFDAQVLRAPMQNDLLHNFASLELP